ncbi:MAG TPA: sialidase family protein [Anaerolineales bacterium]|nr:sialidase family protein [Anaerolineales bacterium]
MNRRSRFPVALVLLLVVLACGPLAVPTITTTPVPPSLPPSQQPLPATLPPTTTVTVSVPTAETFSTHTAPQPAAAPHFQVGDLVQLDSITFNSRTDGWGISGPYVLTTADGGQTWREVTPPQSFPSGTKNQAYGAFLNTQTAWIIFAEDDRIPPEAPTWRTTDGGRNWTRGAPLFHQVFGDSVWVEFAVLNTQSIWVLVRGVYLGAGTHFNHELFRTMDSGLTWTSLDGQISDDYTGMVFADTEFGLRTLQTTGAYAPGPPAYDVTTDGGAAWDSRELPPPPDTPDLFNQYPYCETYQPVLLSVWSIRMLVGCFDSHDPPQRFTNYFYSSQDGGATWQTVHLPDKVQAAQDQLIYFGLNNALLLGRDMYLSTSDGQTWSFVKTVNWDGQFSFSDPQYGWAIARADGEAALVQTSDWAATWTMIKPTITR